MSDPVQFEWPAEALNDSIDRFRDHLVTDIIPRAEQAGVNLINAFFAGLSRVRFNGGFSTLDKK